MAHRPKASERRRLERAASALRRLRLPKVSAQARIVADPSPAPKGRLARLPPLLLTALAVAAATLVRWPLTALWGSGFTFITYYPAILFVTLVAGWGYGLLATVAAATLSVALFLGIAAFNAEEGAALAMFVSANVLMILLGEWVRRARERARSELLEARAREAAREASERRFRVMIESSPIAMMMVDAAGRIVLANAQAERIFGFARKALEGRSIEQLLPERLRARHLDFRRSFLSGPQARPMGAGRELYGRRADGAEFPIEVGLSPVATEEGVFALSTIVDITERKASEARLRESEERFSKAFHASPDALVISRASDGLIREVNESYLRLLGYARAEEVIGHHSMRRGRHIEPADRDRILERFGEQGRVRDFGLTIRRCSGEPRAVLCSIEPLEIGGEPWTLTLVRDITEQQRAAEHRELLVHELSHRVKNTLAIVQAIGAQTLRQADSLDEFGAKFVGRIGALATAHDVLLGEHWRPIELRRLIERVLEPYQAGGRVRLEGPSALIEAPAAVSLAMVLHELATNAAKYGSLSGEGGEVRVRWQHAEGAERPAIELHWRERGGPPVAPPEHAGFGSRLLQSVGREFGEPIMLAFEPEGLQCRIRVPQSEALP